MGPFSIWQWIIVLVVVLLIFGTKRLRGAGRDLGEAIKGFKKGMHDADEDKPAAQLEEQEREATSTSERDRQNEDSRR